VELEFDAGPRMRALAAQIARGMVELFAIGEDEAYGRINRQWRHLSGRVEPTDTRGGHHIKSPTVADMIFRDSPSHWAKTIYYGHDSQWWRGEQGLAPQPYP
jgi:hypothetical protein